MSYFVYPQFLDFSVQHVSCCFSSFIVLNLLLSSWWVFPNVFDSSWGASISVLRLRQVMYPGCGIIMMVTVRYLTCTMLDWLQPEMLTNINLLMLSILVTSMFDHGPCIIWNTIMKSVKRTKRKRVLPLTCIRKFGHDNERVCRSSVKYCTQKIVVLWSSNCWDKDGHIAYHQSYITAYQKERNIHTIKADLDMLYLKDLTVARDIAHNWCQAKYKANDALGKWLLNSFDRNIFFAISLLEVQIPQNS